MRVLWCLLALTGLLFGSAANAAELVVRVVDGNGRPAADAVATLIPDLPAQASVPAAPKPEPRIIDQKDETFIPYVQIVRPGDPVIFRNSDDTRHHVYSFAKIKAFEFVLAPGESSKPLEIAATGVAVVGCNIHDNMIAYLFVSDAPWIAQTGADGDIKLDSLPQGKYTLHVWHPQLGPGHPEIVEPVSLDEPNAKATRTIALSLLPDPRQRMDHERVRY